MPDHLAVRSARILLEDLELDLDLGFHEFEVGNPQRVLITAEIWLEDPIAGATDDPAEAWNYDHLRSDIRRIAESRRFNLQEALLRSLFDALAARAGVRAIRLKSAKPDVYGDSRAVGVEIASFEGIWPD